MDARQRVHSVLTPLHTRGTGYLDRSCYAARDLGPTYCSQLPGSHPASSQARTLVAGRAGVPAGTVMNGAGRAVNHVTRSVVCSGVVVPIGQPLAGQESSRLGAGAFVETRTLPP